MLCFKTTANCSGHDMYLVNFKWAHLWCDLFLFSSFTYLFISLIINLFILLSVCLSVYLPSYLSIHLFNHLFIYSYEFCLWLRNRKHAQTDCRVNFSCCTVLYKLYSFRNSIIFCIVFYPTNSSNLLASCILCCCFWEIMTG